MQATLISPQPKVAPAHYCRQTPPLPLPAPDDGKGALAPWQVRQLTAHIDANLCATLRTTHLAATLGLSVSHFSRAFQMLIGMGPQAWRRSQR